jgi:predicted RNA-binding protein YlqC (UPF0109 family)
MRLHHEEQVESSLEPPPYQSGGDSNLPLERLIRSIAEALVRQREMVHVAAHQDDRGTTLILKVAQEDLRPLVGGQNRTVDSMRTLVQSIGKRQHRRISLHISAVD